jgi:hypothetical protein
MKVVQELTDPRAGVREQSVQIDVGDASNRRVA